MSIRQASRAFRLVCEQAQIPAVLGFLEAEGFIGEPLPFSPFCFRIWEKDRPLGASLAAFFGYIYIQDKSSMLPPLALNPAPGSRVLDLCASPGGKSLFLGQLAGKEGFVLANEPPGPRLGTLRANLLRASLPQVASCVYDGQKIPLNENSWPYILLDAPCSGWGTAQKNPQATKIWRGKKLKPLLSLQRGLLKKAAALLAPGGRLLYSTCTTNIDENENQTRFAIDELGLEQIPLEPIPGFQFQDILPGSLRVDGPASDAQGFYLALLAKKGEPNSAPPGSLPPLGMPVEAGGALALPPGGRAEMFGATIRYVPALARDLPVTWQGYPLGKLAGGVFKPQARLHAFARQDMPRLQLDDPAQIRALLAGTSLNTALPGSFALLAWRDLPLGFVKLKAGRAMAAFR